MKKSILILIAILQFTFWLNAQDAAGYLGKKTMIGATIAYSPAYGILLSDYNSAHTVSDFFLSAPRFGISLKHVLSENNILYVDFTYQNILIQNDFEANTILPTYPYNITTTYSKIRTGVMTFSAGYSKHLHNVSPVGGYFGGNFCLVVLNTQGFDASNKLITDFGQNFDFGWNNEFGVRRVLKDHLVIDAGITVTFYIRGLVSIFTQHSFDDTPTQHILNTALFRNYYDNLCTAKVGVYYLLF